MKVCKNAKVSHRRLQKVELGSQNVKKLKLYHLRYKDRKIVIQIQLGKKKF